MPLMGTLRCFSLETKTSPCRSITAGAPQLRWTLPRGQPQSRAVDVMGSVQLGAKSRIKYNQRWSHMPLCSLGLEIQN